MTHKKTAPNKKTIKDGIQNKQTDFTKPHKFSPATNAIFFALVLSLALALLPVTGGC